MAKKPDGRTFNIGVIGLSGGEKEKGIYGVGKSCLCNRFIHQLEDRYHQEHISVLSQSDFGGRVINNDHFLYWGDVTKTDEGNNFTFHVIEQTEFIDDVSFTPFKTGRTDPYVKRCVQTKVQSAEKLMYICKDQLGMETDSAYEQKLMPDGKLTIDGILCCFDVSRVPDRSMEKQVEVCITLLNNAIKTKKPVVLATTKNDSIDAEYSKEVEKILMRREFKNSVSLVETSAHENINIETAFILLAHLIDKSKTRTKVMPYTEAAKARKEICEVAREAFRNLLKNKITDWKITWATGRKQLEKEPDYQHFVDLFGTEKARSHVKMHTRHLREEIVKRKQALFLKRLPDVLNHFFPDIETVGDRRGWSTCQQRMLQHPDFDKFFVQVCEPGDSWIRSDFVDNVHENRLPMDLLETQEAAEKFHNHIEVLSEIHKKEEMKREFWALLEKAIEIPGSLLKDNYTKFVGKECYTGLQEIERQRVYDEYQQQLQTKVKNDFQELLFEHPSLFRSLNFNKNVTEHDLNVIYNSLNDDQRFRKLMKLDDIRKVMLLNHVVFLEKPTVKSCFFHNSTPDVCTCTECQVSRLLHVQQVPNGRIPSSEKRLTGHVASPLSLVLLGQEGLSVELYQEIRNMCIDDEYKLSPRHIYKLDYRPIDGDVGEEQNSFILPNFKPHGCICVYDSQETLEYLRSSILKTLESNLSKEKSLEGLPIVVMLAYEPYTPTELNYLRESGKLLARSLQCEFVDIPEDDLAEKLKFYPEQIEQALSAIIKGPGASLGQTIMEDTEPDLRILMCMMCSDPYPMQLPLQPFLNESSFMVTSMADPGSQAPDEENVFTFDAKFDANLDYTKQKIEVTVTSYHGAQVCVKRGEIYHGFILVYCPKRKASLASLRAFAEPISPQYFQILAVQEAGCRGFNVNEHSQGLKEGKELAKCLQSRFMQISPSFQQFGALHPQVYEKFLKEVWEHRDDVDDDCDEPSPPPAYEPNYRRPPAPLPNQLHSNQSTSSNSQSTEDSEPLYDQPHILRPHSDSERASSPSPPPLPNSAPPPPGPEPDIFYRNDNALVKPSMLKKKRNEYAALKDLDGPLREQYRKSFPAIDSERLKLSSSMSQSMTEHLDAESALLPQFQFRKSRSMKLAVKDDVEAWAINEPKHHTKSSTFPASTLRVSQSHETPYEPTEWTTNAMYDHSPNRTSSVKYGIPQLSKSTSKSGDQAPLAMPEKIEISEVYGTVKDALIPKDSDYAYVDDALPHGKIQRIKSSSKKNEKGTDSEESECSSLERDKGNRDLYSKVNRKPTPHKKKSKRHSREAGQYITQIYVDPKQAEQDRLHGMEYGERGRSNSPSEDSTGDELQTGRKEKRRSLKKKVTPSENTSVNFSDSEISSPILQGAFEDDENSVLIHKLGDDTDELNESGKTGTWFKKKAANAMREKDKRIKEEERRKQRDMEKKQKEQQKLQKKIKKKDSKATGQSEGGISLADYSMSPNNPSVPHFIEKCIEFIEKEGLHAEGIYRIPGNKGQGDLLTQKYNEDSNVDISTLDIQVNAVATVLKAFFADLSDPLVPLALYDELIEASDVQDKTARVAALRGVFLKMHPLNFEVLKFLITHLHKVSKNNDTNNMDPKNLSRCWWPTLIRMEFETIERFTKYSRIPEEILQTLIEQCSYFFHSGNEI